jgi:ABC-type nitrate/sulfonate/bicarbonate transport system substrate-binding protein
MVKPVVKLLCSVSAHLPLHIVWRESGLAQKHGFELRVECVGTSVKGEVPVTMKDRAPTLLDGTYDFLSGLHHETYVYRARGDKRLVYIAQTQNDWDDRVVASADVTSPLDLQGKRCWVASSAPCVLGNFKHSLQIAGVDLSTVEFLGMNESSETPGREIVEAVVSGKASAACVDMPFDRVGEQMGLHRLEIPSVPVIHNTTFCANREWIQANEETTLAVLRSLIATIHFFKTEKQRVCDILEEHLAPILDLRSSDEIEHLQEGWARLLSPKPYPHPLAVWNVYNLDVAHDPKVNFIGPFEVWDTSYLRSIDDEGFIDALYGGQAEAVNPGVNCVI